MNDDIVKRYSLTEIALLVIFMLGLVVAQILVKVRHRVILSAPIRLAGSGLSVYMPDSAGWEYESTWRYETDNSMALVAEYRIRQSPRGLVQWRYDICSPATSAREILQQRIQRSDSKSANIETIASPVPMEYTIVYPTGESDSPFYLGVASLDFGRHLELRVFVYQQLDLSYAEDLFRALAAGIDYQPPKELQAGKEFMTSFWNAARADSLSIAQKNDQAFLIKSAENRAVGYSCYHYSILGDNSEAKLQIRARQYEHNLSLSDSTFWSDGGQKRFTWKTTIQHIGMGQPRNYTLVQEADGSINVNADSDKAVQFASDGLLLPELLLSECAATFLEHEQPRIVIDGIAATGFVVPTIMEKIDPTDASVRSEQIAFVVKTDFLNSTNSFEELYFDKDRRFIGRFEQQPARKRLWELTTPDQLEKIFKGNFQPINGSVAAAE